LDEIKHTFSTSGKLHISPLHAEEIIAFTSLLALLNHRISMRQFAAQDVTEDLRISVRVCWESLTSIDAVLVQDSQTAKILELGIVVVGKTECVVTVKPTMVGVSALVGPARHNFGVRKSFRHCVFDD